MSEFSDGNRSNRRGKEEGESISSKSNAVPQSTIYELIHDTINKDAFSIGFPQGVFNRFIYIILIPLTHL
jgi:hypothetical protein